MRTTKPLTEDNRKQLLAAATDLYCLGGGRPAALERAAVWTTRVLAGAPRGAAALRLLGLIELERRRPGAAGRAFARLADLPGTEERLTGLAGLAQCYLARRQPDQARHALSRAERADLVLQPALLECQQRHYAVKAAAYVAAGQPSRARQVLRRAVGRCEQAGLDADPLRYELLGLSGTSGGAGAAAELPLLVAQHLPQELLARPAAGPASYSIAAPVVRRIAAACEGRHEERCGLLFGRGRRIEQLRLLRNTSELPEISAESQPWQRRRLWLQERRRGRVLLAELHSHTAGPAVPSRADVAGPGRLLVIYSDIFEQLRAWRVGCSYEATLAAERPLRTLEPAGKEA